MIPISAVFCFIFCHIETNKLKIPTTNEIIPNQKIIFESGFIIPLKNLIKSVDDKVTSIKLNEIVNIISELSKESSIKNEDIVNLLQYYQLIDEIRTASKQNIKWGRTYPS